MNKANLKRRIEALKSQVAARTSSDNSESAYWQDKFASMSNEELQRYYTERWAEPREPQPWDDMNLQELLYYYADQMRTYND